MSLRVESESAFVLHTRPYRNTSLLVDFLTEKYGRITAIARSARGLRSRYKNIFRPFSPLWVNWIGRTELRNLNNVEIQRPTSPLTGEALYCGLYINELLFKLLLREEACPSLFLKYSSLIETLAKTSASNETALRYFEKHLLIAIGYGLSLQKEANNETLIQPDLFYTYIPKSGFVQAQKHISRTTFSGKCLIALEAEILQETQLLKEAKKLMRIALQDALEHKRINARQLF